MFITTIDSISIPFKAVFFDDIANENRFRIWVVDFVAAEVNDAIFLFCFFIVFNQIIGLLIVYLIYKETISLEDICIYLVHKEGISARK